ncbi:MAG: Crp/Fnr family transcriptional regulator [Ktedonobacteraceae bacterium]|nr:Crp/Fnr family transcriptional regulator [Ktedonobacteraceae bacterium]
MHCLSAVDIFQDLSPAEILELSSRAPIRKVEAKALLYSPERPLEVLFMINEGRVQIYSLSLDGRMITHAILEAGTLFGEMALMGQSLHGSYAQALDPCTLCVMNVADVRTLLLNDTRVAQRVLEILGKRLLDVERRISILTLKLVPIRVISLLLHLSENGLSSEIRCTHEELASMVGANRETVTRVLNELRARDAIEVHRGRITILDPQQLLSIEQSEQFDDNSFHSSKER